MAQPELDQLRSIVQDSLGKHMYDNAIFFADKLVTMSGGAGDDVYLLCQAYVFTKQHRRALHVLRTTRLATSAARFRYLTAKCLAECQEWDECLDTLDEKALEAAAAAEADGGGGGKGHIGLHSSMLLLKGSVYESLENWPLAARHYCEALRAEPLNYEALHRLLSNHMLGADAQHVNFIVLTDCPCTSASLSPRISCSPAQLGTLTGYYESHQTIMEPYLVYWLPGCSSTTWRNP